MKDSLAHFTSFYTRYYKSDTGLESSLWLLNRILNITQDRPDIVVSPFNHDWPQKSIIVKIPGKSSSDNPPVVIVGAHQDSINLILPSILGAPGADDDGSGTVTILDVLRVLVKTDFYPENQVEFHWYSAEEGGLLGSQDIFTSYAKKGVNVVAMLQQDMTGYIQKTLDNGLPEALGIIDDFVHEGLTEFIKTVIDGYCDISYAVSKCGYGCSDHASAYKVGYPSAFVIEAAFNLTSSYIHTTLDTLDRLSFDHMAQHAKLTLGYAYELAHAKF